jgi:outer membrane lipoprotein-sorting protein
MKTGANSHVAFMGFQSGRKKAAYLLIFAAFGLLLTRPAQSGQKWSTDSVLGMMDSGARDFRTLTANIEHIKYTEVVKDTSTESGQMWLQKKDEKMRIEFAKPDPRTILRSGDSLAIYNPKINRVEEYDLGKNRALVDQYVRLGFGTRSEDLRKSFDVEFSGEQDLDGRKTLLLELTPKNDQMRTQISRIQMWVDESAWLPLQQKFFEAGSGDYFVFHYTDIKKNLKIEESRFKPNWPKNASKVKPRG